MPGRLSLVFHIRHTIFKPTPKKLLKKTVNYTSAFNPYLMQLQSRKSTSSTKFPPLATHCVNYLYRLPRLK